MKGFLRMYRKELRFLAGPGIGIIVIMMANRLLTDIIHCISPSGYYHSNNIYYITRYNPPFIVKYITGPISGATEYIFAVLFLYAVMHEHITQSRYQLLSLPTRRGTHLAAKCGAVVTWALTALLALFMLRYLKNFVSLFIPGLTGYPGIISIKSIVSFVLSTSQYLPEKLSICALAMLGYVVAITVRRYKFFIGTATFIAGYLFMGRLDMTVDQFFYRNFACLEFLFTQRGVPATAQAMFWSGNISNLISAVIFLITALLLYELYGEV